MTARRLRVVGLPAVGHAYQDCFYQALAQRGVGVVPGYFTGGWLLLNVRAGDVVHLHWPSFFYASASALRSAVGLARYALFLVLLRMRGARIAWTAHNLYPHQPTRLRGADRFARWLTTRLAERVFAHGAHAVDAVAAEFGLPAEKLVDIPHGHWVGYFAHDMGSETARRQLGIGEDTRVLLSFGAQEAYKNIPVLLRAFAQAREGSDQLWIVGRSRNPVLRDQIHRLAQGIPGVHVVDHYIEDGEIQHYMAAADMAVLPYRDGLTSGAAMLALSFGVPVLAPRAICFSAVVDDRCGRLYETQGPDDEAALVRALRDSRRSGFDAEAIRARACQFRWQDAADRFVGAFQKG